MPQAFTDEHHTGFVTLPSADDRFEALYDIPNPSTSGRLAERFQAELRRQKVGGRSLANGGALGHQSPPVIGRCSMNYRTGLHVGKSRTTEGRYLLALAAGLSISENAICFI